MVAVCVDDPNWNFDEQPLTEVWEQRFVSGIGREKCATELSHIVIQSNSDVIRNVVKEAIITQDRTDVRWSSMSSTGVENLCRMVRVDFGRRLMIHMRDKHNSEIKAKVLNVLMYFVFDLYTRDFS